MQDVVAAAADDGVVAGAAVDKIPAVPGVDIIAARAADQDVVAAGLGCLKLLGALLLPNHRVPAAAVADRMPEGRPMKAERDQAAVEHELHGRAGGVTGLVGLVCERR